MQNPTEKEIDFFRTQGYYNWLVKVVELLPSLLSVYTNTDTPTQANMHSFAINLSVFHRKHIQHKLLLLIYVLTSCIGGMTSQKDSLEVEYEGISQ